MVEKRVLMNGEPQGHHSGPQSWASGRDLSQDPNTVHATLTLLGKDIPSQFNSAILVQSMPSLRK